MTLYQKIKEKFPLCTFGQINNALVIIELYLKEYSYDEDSIYLEDFPDMKYLSVIFECGYVGPDSISIEMESVSFTYNLLGLI